VNLLPRASQVRQNRHRAHGGVRQVRQSRHRAHGGVRQVRPRRHRAHGRVRQVRWRRPLPGNVPPRARPKSDRVGTELMEEFGKSGGVVRSPATCLPVHVPSPTASAPSSWRSSASPVASSAPRQRASPCTSQVRPRRHRAHGGVRQVRRLPVRPPQVRPRPGNVPRRPECVQVRPEVGHEPGSSCLPVLHQLETGENPICVGRASESSR